MLLPEETVPFKMRGESTWFVYVSSSRFYRIIRNNLLKSVVTCK